MEILVVSVKTGSAQVKGRAENWSETGRTSGRIETGAPASSPTMSGTGPPPNTFAPGYSHSDHGRSRQSLGHPTDLPPWMLPRRLWPTIARLRQAGEMSRLRQEKRNSPLPDAFLSSSFPFAAHASTLQRYRTTHFDNLRRTWKSRMYWEYTKTSDLVNPKSKARAKLSCRLKRLIR